MAEFFQLDYGYEVKVVSGGYKGTRGFIVMGSRFGDVGINTNSKPKIGDYQVRALPRDLEVISREDLHRVARGAPQRSISPFEEERMLILHGSPQYVVDNPQFFTEREVESAKTSLRLRVSRAKR